MRIFCDVGGTLLLGSNDRTSLLNQPLISAIKEYVRVRKESLHLKEVEIVVWSFYGKETAEIVARRAFHDEVCTVMDKNFEKPEDFDIVIDDHELSMERLLIVYTEQKKLVAIYKPDEFIEMMASPHAS